MPLWKLSLDAPQDQARHNSCRFILESEQVSEAQPTQPLNWCGRHFDKSINQGMPHQQLLLTRRF